MRSIVVVVLLNLQFFTWGQSTFQLGFYNVENLFDTLNTPAKLDGEFTPSGVKRYNTEKYWLKLNRIARVIAAINDWKGMLELIPKFYSNAKMKRTGITGVFAASLELTKEGQIQILQKEIFEKIMIKKASN